MIKISVIIPIYNMEKYLNECLDSILHQTLKEIELICVDDGSTDQSYNILMDYARKYENIIVIKQQNQGAGAARNTGIKQAMGKYLCFMDPDDFYAQNCVLEKLYNAAEENHVLVCGGNLITLLNTGNKEKISDWFSENKRMIYKDYGEIYYYTKYIFQSKMIKKNNIVFPLYKRYQDPPFFLKAMIFAKEFYVINDVVYVYRNDYKEMQYTYEKAIDILKGIRDCFSLAYEENLKIVFEKRLKNVLYDYLYVFGRFAYQGRSGIWDLIEEINHINRKWGKEISEIFYNKENMTIYLNKLKSKQDVMLAKFRKEKNIVIYGAGKAGKFFLNSYGHECGHIQGFAVSEWKGESCVSGYCVKEITEYSKSALIIVAVSSKYAKEILDKLAELQYQNVYYVEYTELRILKGLEGV